MVFLAIPAVSRSCIFWGGGCFRANLAVFLGSYNQHLSLCARRQRNNKTFHGGCCHKDGVWTNKRDQSSFDYSSSPGRREYFSQTEGERSKNNPPAIASCGATSGGGVGLHFNGRIGYFKPFWVARSQLKQQAASEVPVHRPA